LSGIFIIMMKLTSSSGNLYLSDKFRWQALKYKRWCLLHYYTEI